MRDPIRIAGWSGPRNLSTAMMRSFSSRADTAVWDEPFYGAYLKATGSNHPLKDATMAAWGTDFATISGQCIGPIPDNRPVFYQKHMTHHMLHPLETDWLNQLTHMFMIRHPARVIASYHAKLENPALADLGFVRQTEIFEQVINETGQKPAILDTDDLLSAPQPMLEKLCQTIGLAFDPAMLEWPAGRHPADGPWSDHWYGSVWRSTGFAPPKPLDPHILRDHAALIDQAMPYYEKMAALKLTA